LVRTLWFTPVPIAFLRILTPQVSLGKSCFFRKRVRMAFPENY
jgi:hypothetical protein